MILTDSADESTVRCLILKSRVSYDGVSDGSTFGLPLYLSPITLGVAATVEGYLRTNSESDIEQNSLVSAVPHNSVK